MPEGVRLLDDPHKLLVTIKTHGKEAEEEAPAEAPAEEGAEPEVIRKGKAAEEGEGGEAE